MSQHVCPFWVGYLLLSPVRKLITNPDRILEPYVRSGMTVMDAGTAMGFFSLPLAELVGVTTPGSSGWLIRGGDGWYEVRDFR